MPKKKTPKSNIDEVLGGYDATSLLGELNTLEGSLGWKLFTSFVYYQAAVHGTMSNVLIQETGKQFEACSAASKAEVLREISDKFMDVLRKKVVGDTGVLTSEIPHD